MKEKKIPLRMCVGCREMKPKRELIRVVRTQDGGCAADLTGRAPGRGAYLCRSSECLAKAVKSKALDRALEIRAQESVCRELEAMFAQDRPEEA